MGQGPVAWEDSPEREHNDERSIKLVELKGLSARCGRRTRQGQHPLPIRDGVPTTAAPYRPDHEVPPPLCTTRQHPTSPPQAAVRTGADIVTSRGARRALAASRIVVGAYLLWAFFDKLLGLGYVVPPEGAWIRGGTPAQGFINHIAGPFAGVFSVFANPVGDVLFMAALLGIGVAMVLGIGLRVAAVSGTALMTMLYLAEFPLTNGGTNPIIDDHWLFAAIMITSALTLAGDTWGLGRAWARKVGDGWLR